MDVRLIVIGIALLLADLGVVFALRRRIPADRMSLYTLPFFAAGIAVLVVGFA